MELILKLWLYLAFGLSGALLMYIIKERKNISLSKLLSILIVITLPFHMFEERIYPGGFSYIYNAMSGLDQTQLVMLSCNVTVLVVLTLVWWKKGDKPWFVFSMAIFGLMEFILHTIEAVKSIQMFTDAGMKLPYSPGWITTIIFCVPIAVASIVHLVKSKQLVAKEVARGIGFTMVIAVTTILLPNVIFNGSAYPFPDAGYYEQFLNRN